MKNMKTIALDGLSSSSSPFLFYTRASPKDSITEHEVAHFYVVRICQLVYQCLPVQVPCRGEEIKQTTKKGEWNANMVQALIPIYACVHSDRTNNGTELHYWIVHSARTCATETSAVDEAVIHYHQHNSL